MITKRKIQDLEKCDRPRERLREVGASALSDEELLALILGKGTKGKDVLTLASETLQVMDGCSGPELYGALSKIHGIGTARASQLIASIELTKRRIHPSGVKIRLAADLVPYLSQYTLKKKEHFLSVTLNGANEIIAIRCVSIGIIDAAHVHPREVFADAIADRASSLIVAHNHPSGDLTPSKADLDVTKRLSEAGKLLGIKLLDHIIISSRGFVSLRDLGEMA